MRKCLWSCCGLPVDRAMNFMTVYVCGGRAFLFCQWKTLVSWPVTAIFSSPLFNSVHQHFLLQPVSVTPHFLSGLNQSNSPQLAWFWVSHKRQRASKPIAALLTFIDPKNPPSPPKQKKNSFHF